MPEWKKVSDYCERLNCRFGTLVVERSKKIGTFNIFIYAATVDGITAIYERKDFFPGSSEMKHAQRFLIAHYRGMLEKEMAFLSDKSTSGTGVF
jgi:hypothetical protein